MASRALDITASPCRPEGTVISPQRLPKVASHIPHQPAPDTAHQTVQVQTQCCYQHQA